MSSTSCKDTNHTFLDSVIHLLEDLSDPAHHHTNSLKVEMRSSYLVVPEARQGSETSCLAFVFLSFSRAQT